MNTSLQRKMLVAFMAVVILIMAGFAVGVSAVIREYFMAAKQQELLSKGYEMARVMEQYFAGRITQPQLAEVVDIIDDFLDARIWVADSSGKFVVTSSPRHLDGSPPVNTGSSPVQAIVGPGSPGHGPGQGVTMGPQGPLENERTGMRTSTMIRALLPELEPVFKGEIWTRTFFHPFYGEEMMIVALPVSAADKTVKGVVVLNAPVQGINDFLMRLYLAITATGILATLFTFFVVNRLAGSIVRPIRKMQETASAMARGDYESRVDEHSPDEIGELGHSLNRLAQELSDFVGQTAQTEKLRRDFVANVSHELRTPLTVIKGYTEALQDGTVSDPTKVDEVHRMILSETERLERLITDLLDLSRLQSVNYSLELEAIPLAELAENVTAMMTRRAKEQGVELSVKAELGPTEVQGDGDRLTQLLLILLDNALKYTGEGGWIRVEITLRDSSVVMSVSDSGVGIAAEDLPFIWGRFYKADKARTRESGGTGIGLAIAREIIEHHHAQVQVESTPGEGTVFTLHFPIQNTKEEIL